MDAKQQLSHWIDEYSDRLLRVAYIYMRDRSLAEDKLQDAFIKAYNAMNQLLNHDNPFPWLAQIVINECRSNHKLSWREITTALMPEEKYTIDSSEDVCLRHFAEDELHHAIFALPERYRIPIVPFHFEELSIQEISNLLRVKEATVKTRLSRGRQRLKKILEEERKNEQKDDLANGPRILQESQD